MERSFRIANMNFCLFATLTFVFQSILMFALDRIIICQKITILQIISKHWTLQKYFVSNSKLLLVIIKQKVLKSNLLTSPFDAPLVGFPILLLNFLTALPRVIRFLTCLDIALASLEPSPMSSGEELQNSWSIHERKEHLKGVSLVVRSHN